VGTLAVQIAKTFGADVTGVSSSRNVDLVRSLSADRVIAYMQKDFTTRAERYDLLLDCAGNPWKFCASYRDRKVLPVIDKRYPLGELSEAIPYLETGHARGKIVITVK
jgi:NADPH:quinone reductase-like Zn-dependent oxidoreductase